MLELRVLTGTHAGARVLLPDQPQKLGSAPDCDLILTDEGLLAHHAQIEAREDGSVLLRWLGEPGGEVVLQAGEGAELGAVRIAIDTADSPWREDVEIRSPITPPQDDDASDTPGTSPVEDGQSKPGGARKGREAAGAKGSGGGRLAQWLSGGQAAGLIPWTFGGLGLVAVGVALLQIFHGVPGFSSTGSNDGAARAAAAASGQAALTGPEAVAAAIAPLGLGTRVRVDPDSRSASPGVRVKAAYLDEAQARLLRETLQRLPNPPRLDILSASQVQAQLEDALLMEEGSAGNRLLAVPLESGRFRLQGRVGSRQQQEELLARLARAVPWVQELESGLRVDEDEAAALLQALQALGLGEVEGQWIDGRLDLRARIATTMLPRWERGLSQAVALHPIPFRVSMSAAPPPTAASLPFTLRSVVGGGMPFVTLADGRRLAVDGQAEGWRLMAIRPEAVVFENAQGLRFTLER